MIKLNKNVNYIVSGLERSGTSLMMQILKASGVPVAYDNTRKKDKNNPNGYFELESGKIIDKLKDGTFPLDKYKGKFIKITSWGLQFLPKGKYEVIYMMRNVDEIIDSTEKMSKKKMSKKEKDEMRECLVKFEKQVLRLLEEKHSSDFGYVVVFYNTLLKPSSAKDELGVLASRFGCHDIVERGIKAIDKKLYRNRSE